ncbi:nitrogenase component 1 [Clostridium sp. BJN0013]|uniref:nitrogenase component 1 n=1 Tax=Clostridium sp. BJN0013 TaxID=3236840 RepID=UPI0034C60D69
MRLKKGRYLDAMIDNHKYTGEARVVLYGEPELLLSTARLCVENGILVKVAGTGSRNPILKKMLKEELKAQKEDSIVLDDTDFETMESYAKRFNINLMIGNSDGRRMAKKLGVKLIRTGFPIHDRVGGQRQVITAYNGSLFLIDAVSNAMLEITQNSYREKAYNDYYLPILDIEEDNSKSNRDKSCTENLYSDEL